MESRSFRHWQRNANRQCQGEMASERLSLYIRVLNAYSVIGNVVEIASGPPLDNVVGASMSGYNEEVLHITEW